jgi:putative ABC transport system permease protein
MQSLLGNLRFGARMLIKNPGFTLATILTLALGIGANTAIFTVTSALLLRPFPYHHPEQLVVVNPKDQTGSNPATLMRYELVRDANKSFESVAVWANDNLNLTGSGEPIQIPIARVSPTFFSMLGVQPPLGRIFSEDEGRPEGKPVVILSDSLWRTRFHSDPNIVGQTLTLDSMPQTIVGVLPANMEFPFVGPAEVWTPRYFEYSLMSTQRLRLGVGYLTMIARLHPGVTRQQADAELAVLHQRYREQNPTLPDAYPTGTMSTDSLRDLVVGDVRGKVLVLSAAVALVLLIACANVASLLLSRALARTKEIAVRTALGASRASLIFQLLTESMMLALTAGVLGVGLSWAATHALVAWGASQLPQGIPIGLDLSVLAFSVGISIAAGLIFGTIPALQLARANPNSALRDEGRGISVSRTRAHLKDALVIGQIALSLLLFIGAGLLLRSFVRLLNVNPGFDAENVLTMNVTLPSVKYSKPEQQIAFYDELLRRVAPLPGVRSAATSAALPLGFIRMSPVLAEGQRDQPLAQRPFVDIEAISSQWFHTMRVPLRSGREFTDADNATGPKVIIVNETFARQFWPNENPIGKHVLIGRQTAPAEIIGVAADVKNRGLEPDTQAQIYLPFPQLPWGRMNLLVRTAVPPRSMISAIRAQIASIDSDQPVMKIQTVDELMDNSRSQPRFTMLLLGGFSGVALALAVIGIYGVLSYSVAQRRQEFGIRLALGAERDDILHLVVRHGFLLAVAGVTIGLIASLALTHLMASLLYKIGTHDVTTFALTSVVLLAIALAASYIPAHRATKVNPIEALR